MKSYNLPLRLILPGLLIAASLLFFTCGNSIGPSDIQKISLSVSEWLAAGDASDSQVVVVTSMSNSREYSWSVEYDSSWIRVTPSSGTTPDSFTITVDSNKAGIERSCTLSVGITESDQEPEQFSVTQNPMTGLILLSTYPAKGFTEFISVDGDYAYTSVCYDELNVLDISDFSNPFKVGTYPYYERPMNIIKHGNNVYTAGWKFRDGRIKGVLKIYDVTSPIKPVLQGTYESDYINRIAIYGNYIYAAEYYGLAIIDISDTGNPVRVSSQEFEFVGGVAIFKNFVIFSDGSQRLIILDTTDPMHLVAVDTFPVNSPVNDIYVEDDYAYLACEGDGFKVIDLSDINNPVLTAEYNTGGNVYRLRAKGQYLYVVDWNKGLLIFDISMPENPILVASYKTAGRFFDMDVVGQFVYAADANCGLFIFRFVP